MVINVASLDWDGCAQYLVNDTRSGDALTVDKRGAFFQQLLQNNTSFILNFSARQSCDMDMMNSFRNQNASVTQGLKAIAQALARSRGLICLLDKKMLTDIEANQPNGTTFDYLLNYFSSSVEVLSSVKVKCLTNSNKTLYVYMQSHRLAMLYPDEQIVLRIYEDTQEIIFENYAYYMSNLELLPKNIVVEFYYFNKEFWEYNRVPYRLIDEDRQPIHLQGAGETNLNHDAMYRELYKEEIAVLDVRRGDRHIVFPHPDVDKFPGGALKEHRRYAQMPSSPREVVGYGSRARSNERNVFLVHHGIEVCLPQQQKRDLIILTTRHGVLYNHLCRSSSVDHSRKQLEERIIGILKLRSQLHDYVKYGSDYTDPSCRNPWREVDNVLYEARSLKKQVMNIPPSKIPSSLRQISKLESIADELLGQVRHK